MSFEEQLIEEVKKYEYIYNLKHQDYNKISKKDTAWNAIAKALGKEDKLCRRKWKNLRDTYKKVKQNSILRAREGSSKDLPLKKWKNYKFLLFLDDYEYYRKALQNSIFDAEASANENISCEFDLISPIEPVTFVDSKDITTFSLSSTSTNDGSNSNNAIDTNNNKYLSNFIKGATNAIEKIADISQLANQNSPLVNHFISLAQRIETANISETTKLLIEKEVSQWVLERLYNELKTVK